MPVIQKEAVIPKAADTSANPYLENKEVKKEVKKEETEEEKKEEKEETGEKPVSSPTEEENGSLSSRFFNFLGINTGEEGQAEAKPEIDFNAQVQAAPQVKMEQKRRMSDFNNDQETIINKMREKTEMIK